MFILNYYFSIKNSRRINIDKTEVELLKSGDLEAFLSSEDISEMVSSSSNLKIIIKGFKSEDEARNYIPKLEFILDYYGIQQNIRIIKNNDVNISIEKEENTLFVDTDGKTRYDFSFVDDLKLSSDINFNVKYDNDNEQLQKYFNLSLNNDLSKFEQIALAIKLFNSSIDDSSTMSFISIVTALEILSSTLSKEKKKSNKNIIKIIGLLNKYLNTLDEEEKDKQEVMSNIGKFKYKSKTNLIKEMFKDSGISMNDLVQNYTLDNFIKECYDIRSSIVHGSEYKDNELLKKHSFPDIVNELRKQTKKVIDYQIKHKFESWYIFFWLSFYGNYYIRVHSIKTHQQLILLKP